MFLFLRMIFILYWNSIYEHSVGEKHNKGTAPVTYVIREVLAVEPFLFEYNSLGKEDAYERI